MEGRGIHVFGTIEGGVLELLRGWDYPAVTFGISKPQRVGDSKNHLAVIDLCEIESLCKVLDDTWVCLKMVTTIVQPVLIGKQNDKPQRLLRVAHFGFCPFR